MSYGYCGRINAVLPEKNGKAWVVQSRIGDGRGLLCEVTSDHLDCHGKKMACYLTLPVLLQKTRSETFGSAQQLSLLVGGLDLSAGISCALHSADGLSGVEALAVAPDNSI